MDNTLQRLREINHQKAATERADARHAENLHQGRQTQETILAAFHSLIAYLEQKTSKVEVTNHLKEIGTPDALKVVEALDDLHETIKTHENTDLTEVTEVLKQVLAETKALPKEHPTIDIPSEVTVANMPDNKADFKALLDAIKTIKMVAEAPVVNVPAPEVIVKTDMKPTNSLLKEAIKAFQAIVIPEVPTTDMSTIEKQLKKANKLLSELLDKPMGGGGGGGGRATPYQTLDTMPIFPNVVESVDVPGLWGVVMLNPDGTSIGTGGSTTPAVDNLLMETGDGLLLETGDLILLEA